MSDAPDTIYLQWHGDGDPDEPGDVHEPEVTWSRARVYRHDVRYVRAAPPTTTGRHTQPAQPGEGR